MRSERWGCMMQGKTFAGWLARTFPAYRDRLIEDRRFFFKVWPDSPHLKEVRLWCTVHKERLLPHHTKHCMNSSAGSCAINSSLCRGAQPC